MAVPALIFIVAGDRTYRKARSGFLIFHRRWTIHNADSVLGPTACNFVCGLFLWLICSIAQTPLEEDALQLNYSLLFLKQTILENNSVIQQERNLGEQAIDKVVEIAISSQLDESESLSVTVETQPFQLAQGGVDSVTIEGEGLVMKQDLRVTELQVEVKDISVNPLSAMFGKIELNGPAFGTARAVLTENDINRAFNSEYISDKLRELKVNRDGQTVTIDVKSVECKLLSEGKIALDSEVLVRETAANEKIYFTAKPQIDAGGWAISLQDVEYPENKEFSPELTAALADKAGEVLNLRNFEIEGMSLRIQKLDVEAGLLTLQAEAKVEQFPS